MTVQEAMKYFDSVKTEPSDAAEAGKVLADEVSRLSGMRRKFLVEAWEHRQVSFEVEADNEEDAKKVAEDVYQNDERLQDIMIHDDESVAYDEFNVLTDLGPANGVIGNDAKISGKNPEDERKKSRASILYCLDYLMHSLNDEEAAVPWLESGVPDGTYQGSKNLTGLQLKEYECIDDGPEEFDRMAALASRILFREFYPEAYEKAFCNPDDKDKYERKVLT